MTIPKPRDKYSADDTRSKNFRRQVLARDQDAGILTCPYCNVPLDYTNGRAPNGAQADHIIPVRQGGNFHPDNGQTICATCNASKGARKTPKAVRPHTTNINGLITW